MVEQMNIILKSYRETALDDARRAADLLDEAAAATGDPAKTEREKDAACRRLLLGLENAANNMRHYFAQQEWAHKMSAGDAVAAPHGDAA